MKDSETIKLLVCYKNKSEIINSDLCVPIQTGRAIAKETFPGMIGDDTGENISCKNELYSELTAYYWAWKNRHQLGNPNYIGFMHYRRHFIFNESSPLLELRVDNKFKRGYSCVPVETFYPSYVDDIGLDLSYVKNSLRKSDFICAKGSDVSYIPAKSACDEYLLNVKTSRREDYDNLVEVLLKHHPEYANAVFKFSHGTIKHFYNMFVMKWELFEEYCSFLFPILFEVEPKINIQNRCREGYRVMGYLAEIMLSMFIFKKKEEKLAIKELYVSYIKDTKGIEVAEDIDDSHVGIAMGCSASYAPYLCVYLQSIKDNSNSKRKYDIYILESSFSQETRERIEKWVATENISIRFVNPERWFQDKNLHIDNKSLSRECYYRLAAPYILQDYKKIIITDIDLICKNDIGILSEVDMEGCPLAACIDSFWGGIINRLPDKMNYAVTDLELEDPYQYFNTGVMVVDTDYFVNNDLLSAALEMSSERRLCLQEQDALNILLKDKIKKLDTKWNVEVNNKIIEDNYEKYVPRTQYGEWEICAEDPYILHFVASRKPWFFPFDNFSHVWWHYARLTPFYEEILHMLMSHRISQVMPHASNAMVISLRQELGKVHFPNIGRRFAKNEREIRLMYVMEHCVIFKLKKWRYALGKIFSFGEKYKKYQQKYDATKNLLKEAKELKKVLRRV